MTEQIEQEIGIRFCVKLEHSSMETIQVIQKAVTMGNSWLAASSWQHTCSCITSCAVFGETSNHSGDLFPLQPKIVCDNFCFFPKPKSPLKGKRFQIIEIQKNMVGADGDWENCVKSQGAHCEGAEAHFLCTVFPLSSSVSVSLSYYMAGCFLDRSCM